LLLLFVLTSAAGLPALLLATLTVLLHVRLILTRLILPLITHGDTASPIENERQSS
jgi:hypothetical protein